MFDKMTKEEFIKIKTKLKQLFEDAERKMDLNEGDLSFDMQEFENFTIQKYYELELELTKKDLSGIPYKEWEGIDLIVPEGKTLDFSSTKAKLDFAYVTVDGEVILHNCDIKNGDKISYNENTYSNDYKEKHPEMFLSDKFSPEIKEKFYHKTLTIEDMSKLSLEEIEELKDKNIKINDYTFDFIKELKCFSKLVKLYSISSKDYDDIIKIIMYIYNNMSLSKLDNKLKDIEDISELKENAYSFLREYLIKYDSSVLNTDGFPEDFILSNKDLFLIDVNIPEEVKNRYFRHILYKEDIINNLETFDNIVIDNFLASGPLKDFAASLGYGNLQKIMEKYGNIFIYLDDKYEFPKWLDSIKGVDYYDEVKNKLEVLKRYQKIDHEIIKDNFKEYVMNNDNIFKEDLDKIVAILENIVKSNSLEVKRIRDVLIDMLLKESKPEQKFKDIESIFLENNLPMLVKVYYVFEYLHPNALGFGGYDKLSPVLKNSEGLDRNKTIYLDLLKCALGSNNRSLKEFISLLEKGSSLFSKVALDVNLFNALSEEDIKILKDFASSLNSLYNLSQNEFINPRKNNDKLLDDLEELKTLFGVTKRYDLLDRIARMFAAPLGIKSFDELKSVIENEAMLATQKGILNAKKPFVFERGDLLKGINNIQFLNSILQNGSVAKEFLGYAADSDCTPLDTDVSLITDPSLVSGGNFNIEAGGYGPIWVVLKNKDGRFLITRGKEDVENVQNDFHKLELFRTGYEKDSTHYGIRTGFASSEIDYIISQDKDKRINLEIAKNGFYIPVVDKSGTLIFTYEDYLDLRRKMGGLKYYSDEEYHYSSQIISEAQSKTKEEKEDLTKRILLNKKEVELRRKSITNYLAKVLEEFGELHYGYIRDLVPGKMELINTGSTGRGTNIPGAGDFDFYLKLDDTVYSNSERLAAIRNKLYDSLPHQNDSGKPDSTDGNLRLENVVIPGLDSKVDIDITFGVRTDKIELSTDEALKSYFEGIKKDNPDYYNLIIENILKAKMLLKENGIYKKLDNGLGGVGIENWIIQNGGSFEEACRTFLEKATEAQDFKEFKELYQIWDFGEDHSEGVKVGFNYDNFIEHLNPESYQKMVEVLRSYLATLSQNSTLSNEEILVEYSKGARL